MFRSHSVLFTGDIDIINTLAAAQATTQHQERAELLHQATGPVH